MVASDSYTTGLGEVEKHMSRLFLAVTLTIMVAAQTALAQQPCENLASLRIGTATITSATSVAEAPYEAPLPPGQPAPAAEFLPAHCEVEGVIRPTEDSEIKFAVWLPASDWNGKYRQEGNGGWAGAIPYTAMVDPLKRGYVTAGTDNGHEGSGIGTGAAWAIGHPEKLVDFGHRAVHEVAEHAKAITHAFYGQAPTLSYFVGCSDGGREALMEAQRYPADFNGLLVGAPANLWSNLFTAFVWNELAQMETPDSRIPPEKLPLIQEAVLTKCDLLDGVQDSLLNDPRACEFDPSVLLCEGPDNGECLTAPQVEALKKIYQGPIHPRTGDQIYPGIPPGTEAATWSFWIAAADPMQSIQAVLGNPYYGQAVFEDPSWDVRTMDFDKDFAVGEQKAAPILNSSSPDLRSFRALDGKIIQYHGWGDPAISALSSIDYYEAVRGFLSTYPDGRNADPGKIEDFYRLFMVPGMSHCAGGVGPNAFGTRGAVSPAAMTDPERDIFAALERWVEEGTAPERIIGSGPVIGEPDRTMTRPICPYPEVARYQGTGDINDASSFACVATDTP